MSAASGWLTDQRTAKDHLFDILKEYRYLHLLSLYISAIEKYFPKFVFLRVETVYKMFDNVTIWRLFLIISVVIECT